MKRYFSKFLCLLLVAAMLPISALNVYAAPLKQSELTFIDIKDYDEVDGFFEGFAIVKQKSGETFEYEDENGKKVIEERYLHGFINTQGKEVLPVEYGKAERFYNGRAVVGDFEDNEVVYLLDQNFKKLGERETTGYSGETRITNELYYDVLTFHDDISVTYLSPNMRTFVRKDGRWLSDFDSKWNDIFAVSPFSEGLAFAQRRNEDGEFGDAEIIDKNGNTVVKLKNSYTNAGVFENGLALVGISNPNASDKNARLFGFIDKTGKEVIPCQFEDVSDNYLNNWYQIDKAGYIEVKKDGKLQLIDKTGKQVLPGYENYGYNRFEEGLCNVQKNGKWGYIDKDGKEVIPMKFDWAGAFSEGLALFEENKKYGFIDKQGNVIIDAIFDNAFDFDSGHTTVKIGKDWKILVNPLAKSASATTPTTAPKAQTPVSKAEVQAKYSMVKLAVDGKEVSGLEIYNIADNNYFKLRDVAKMLSETDKKFSVEWNKEKKLISLQASKNYESVGGELSGGDGKNKMGMLSDAKLEYNAKALNLKAYTIAGNNYFKLRDLCDALGVKVEWNQATQTIQLTTK